MKLSMSSPYQRLAAHLSGRKARLTSRVRSFFVRVVARVRLFFARMIAGVKWALMLPVVAARSFFARLSAIRSRLLERRLVHRRERRKPKQSGALPVGREPPPVSSPAPPREPPSVDALAPSPARPPAPLLERSPEPPPTPHLERPPAPPPVHTPAKPRQKPPRILPASKRQLRPHSLWGKRIDIFLLIATLVILTFVTGGYIRRVLVDAPPPVSIFVSPQYWTMFGEIADALILEFEGQNPGFRIAVAGPENLDVVFFDDGEYAVLVDSAALACLSPYIYTETYENQWSLPLVSFVDLFFYNIDLLRQAGNDRPPGTRAEFLAAARSVAEMAAAGQEGIFPFAMGLGEADPLGVRRDFYPWVWSLGAEIHSGFAADGSLALTPPTTATINFLAQMHRDGLIAPGTFETTGRERLEQFAEGRIAMMVASARDMLFVRNSPRGVNFDITAVPAAAMGRNRLGISGIYAGISSASERPNEAWGFLVFVAARSHLLASALGAVPGSFFINFPSRYITEDPLYAKAWELFEAADIVEFPSGEIAEKEAGLIIRELLARAFAAE